jgi:hypothetical protein
MPSAKVILGLLGCRGVHHDLISGTWENYKFCSWCPTPLKVGHALSNKRSRRTLILQHDASHCWSHLEEIENTVCEVPPTLCTVLVWHPPITISLVFWKIGCEVNFARGTRHSRQLLISVFGQLEWSSPARNIRTYKTIGKMYKVVRGLCIKISSCQWIICCMWVLHNTILIMIF